MMITHKFSMALDRQEVIRSISAVQGDKNTRQLEITLTSGGAPWPIPADARVLVRFRKSDATGGIYDTLPDGSLAGAISGNTVRFILAPQMLTVAGNVIAQVELNWGEKSVATYTFRIYVEADPSVGSLESREYYNLSAYVAEEIQRILAGGLITKVSQLENDLGFVTEDQLQPSIETALAQAKQSGIFDGDDGYTPVKGVDYFDGEDGIGIASVVQTATSSADGGTNAITVTLTNGTKATFHVKNGSKGSAGADGNDGPQGEKGDKGDKGDAGAIGPQGEPGLVWRGVYSEVTMYAVNDVVFHNGSAYVCMYAKTPQEPSATNSDWSILAQKGDKGNTGTAGAKGDKGDTGPTGATGPQGPQGEKGDTGATGAQGEKGEKGDKGDTGATGPAYTLTSADKSSIAAAVKASLTTETWTFTLEDDTTVTRTVYLA